VVFGSDLKLKAGEVVNGDVAIFGGDLEMADGSRIKGNVVVFGGNGEVNGEVNGDAAFIGGNVSLGPTARVDGDVSSVGGQVDVDKAAYVRGQVIETTRFGRMPFPHFGQVWLHPSFSWNAGFAVVEQFLHIVLGLVWWIVVALLLAAIGLLVVLFLPDQTQAVGQTLTAATPASFGLGLLTQIVGVTVMILLAITICLSPVSLLLAAALGLATLYGWIVIGYLVGQRLLRALQKGGAEPTPVASALAGVFTVTLLPSALTVLGGIPCLGVFFWLMGAALGLLVAATGLGAVVLSRFGTQVYTGGAPTRMPPPPLPPAPPDAPLAPAPEAEQPQGEDAAA
jgi:cytoskeletal protein CcmA (bactofilin family)